MDQLLAQVVTNVLAQQKCHIFDSLLDLHGRLLVVSHDVGVMLDWVNSSMYVPKLGLKRLEFVIARLYLEQLLHD